MAYFILFTGFQTTVHPRGTAVPVASIRAARASPLFIVVEWTVHSATTFKPTSPSDSHTEYAVTSYSVMEKRIFGRRYNTETAKSITEDEYFSPRDIWSIQEGVYLKRNGEYFFAAKGGAGTRYANEEHGRSVMGMVIVPLRNSEDAALITKIIKCEAVDERYARWPGVRDFDMDDGIADFYWRDYCHEVYPDVDVNAFYV